jgi:octopine/nopaline transport system permease protein
MNPELIVDALIILSSGVALTLGLAFLSLALGFILSVPLAFIRAFARPAFSYAVLGYTYVFRGTPMMVQLFLLYYGLSQIAAVRDSLFWVVLRDPFWCALVTFSLNSAAHTTEILCRGLQSVPKGVLEAGAALGLRPVQAARLIAFPIAFRISLPAYGNEVVAMIKGTSLASTVTLLEVTGMARQMISDTFAPYEIFMAAGAIYIFLTFGAVKATEYLEHRLSPRPRGKAERTLRAPPAGPMQSRASPAG